MRSLFPYCYDAKGRAVSSVPQTPAELLRLLQEEWDVHESVEAFLNRHPQGGSPGSRDDRRRKQLWCFIREGRLFLNKLTGVTGILPLESDTLGEAETEFRQLMTDVQSVADTSSNATAKQIGRRAYSIESAAEKQRDRANYDKIIKSDMTANDKLYAMAEIDRRFYDLSSPELGGALGVTAAAVRQTDWWKNRKRFL